VSKFKTTLVTLVFVAACGLVAVGLNAPVGGSQNTNSATTQNTNTGGTENGNTGGGASALSSSDRKFMQEAAAGGMAEVEMARVAVERASSDAVRDYARKMIEDHTRVNEELMQLASAKGVTLPAAADAKHRAMLDKLNRLSGAEFDREYVRNAGVKSHEKMLKLVEGHSRKGRDADARAFATKMVPAVKMHLDMARQLQSGATGGATHTAHPGNANMR
jgi:putative membrane protein